jgi:histidine triad (HIT) family protein
MCTHEPSGYRCPFCLVVNGGETERNRQADIVARDDLTTALIAPKWWLNNRGHVLVVPNEHYENLYDVPDAVLAAVYVAAKRMALALRATYGCDGTSTRQHNEPHGGQDVWHLHVHVFPRYAGDDLYQNHRETMWASAEERLPYAEKLRRFLEAGETPATPPP